MRAAVLSAGSWGTTFGKVLADGGTPVTMWARRAEIVDDINGAHRNEEYLPGIELPPLVTATGDPAEALDGADLVVLSVPSQTLRENLAAWKPALPKGATFVSLMKGIELGTLMRMSEVIAEVAEVDPAQIVVVTGPNLAPEIAARQPTATVVAGTDEARTTAVQDAVTTDYFRPYTNTDVIGCELGGAVKNVIALAYGMLTGMGLGDNTKGTLITRGLAETARLGVKLGADPLTFAGLAGLGDLVSSCVSPIARNRTFGERLGRGETVAEVLAATKQIAEGVKSCRSVRDLARANDVEMPIVEQVERVCHEGLDPRKGIAALMARETKPEYGGRG